MPLCEYCNKEFLHRSSKYRHSHNTCSKRPKKPRIKIEIKRRITDAEELQQQETEERERKQIDLSKKIDKVNENIRSAILNLAEFQNELLLLLQEQHMNSTSHV